MSRERFDALLGVLLEEGLSAGESEELAALLRTRPEWRHELQRHLVLWELWAQQQAPERSAESFLAASRTRLRAESAPDRERFLASLRQRLSGRTEPRSTRSRWFGRWVFAWAAPLAVAAIALVAWLALPRTVGAVTLHGEAICTACMLHESHEHRPVLRIQENGTTRLCYLEADRPLYPEIGNYCTAPIPIDATGGLRTENGRLVLAVRALARKAAPPSPAPETSPDKPALFPF